MGGRCLETRTKMVINRPWLVSRLKIDMAIWRSLIRIPPRCQYLSSFSSHVLLAVIVPATAAKATQVISKEATEDTNEGNSFPLAGTSRTPRVKQPT